MIRHSPLSPEGRASITLTRSDSNRAGGVATRLAIAIATMQVTRVNASDCRRNLRSSVRVENRRGFDSQRP